LHYAGRQLACKKISPLKNPTIANRATPDLVENILIEKLVSGGLGLARTPQVRLVPFAVPGDRGTLMAQGKTSAYWHPLTNPSPARVDPFCQVFGQCGGCQWQMLPVPTQHFWKQAIVAENMARIGKLPKPYPLLPVLPGSPTRNQIKCQVLWGQANHVVLQLVGANPHQRVLPAPCHVVPDAIQQLMAAVQQQPWPLAMAPDTLSIRISDGQALHLVLDGLEPDEADALHPWANTLAIQQPLLQGVHLMTDEDPVTVWGQPHETHTVAGQTFQVGPTCFFQVNALGADQLVSTIAGMAGHGEHLLDAYSGVGLFSKVLASHFRHVTAVESSPQAHACAERNVPAHVDCVNEAMEHFYPTEAHFDVAVIDPPRAGLPQTVTDWLATHVSRRLVLVGCDAAAVSRDMARLVGHGWQLTRVQPIDMFPHTHHVETVVLLEKA
jgi:23S rRNA (uracil1939-C5)-methyltransferase